MYVTEIMGVQIVFVGNYRTIRFGRERTESSWSLEIQFQDPSKLARLTAASGTTTPHIIVPGN